jgi:hypothetical protein
MNLLFLFALPETGWEWGPVDSILMLLKTKEQAVEYSITIRY